MKSAAEHRWVDRQDDLDLIVAALGACERYALDTEFHRERTFFPKLALVQIAWADQLVLLDPLELDLAALRPVFESDSTAVIHAAQQDLDVLTHSVGLTPKRIFDTQVAAGFLGYGTPSLVSLLQGEIGVAPAKGDRLTDWLRRPLTTNQREYAANDVAYLLAVHDRLVDQLTRRGRIDWVLQVCEEMQARPVSGADPERAWLRLKDVRTLRPRARAVAQAVAEWRERRAMQLDQPVRHILADLAVITIAQRQPTTADELVQCRGLDARSVRGEATEQLLDAVARGMRADPPEVTETGEELERDLRPAIALLSAWVSQMSRSEQIDTALLATRADLVALLRGSPGARLSHGWRNEILGDGLDRLLSGRAALTFERGTGLQLVPRDSGGPGGPLGVDGAPIT